MRYLFCLLILFVSTVSACTVGPDYKEPAMTITPEWHTPQSSSNRIDTTREPAILWWESFNDPCLNKLIELTALHNPDIRIAEVNIREARAMRGSARSGFFPKVTAHGETLRQGASENSVQPILPTVGRDYDYYETGFDAVWELDIFGGTRRALEAADARISSAEENHRDIIISILAETARNYVELRRDQQRHAIMTRLANFHRKHLDLTHKQYVNGDVPRTAVHQAAIQVHAAESLIPPLTAAIRAAAYRLAVLTGQEPQNLLDELLVPVDLAASIDIVPTGLRSDILRRRPDIRKAERLLAAETADIGTVTAELFPSFFLTGAATLQTITFSKLFTGTSLAYSLGPNIQWPIFRGGEIRAKIKAEEAQAEAAAIYYEKVILEALAESETALVQYGESITSQNKISAALKNNRQNLKLVQQRFAAGEDNRQAVIIAEIAVANTEDSMVQAQTQSLLSLIGLYKALGGGWEAFAPAQKHL